MSLTASSGRMSPDAMYATASHSARAASTSVVATTPVGVSSPTNSAASMPAFDADEVMMAESHSPGKASVDRMDVDPILPVPQTATRCCIRSP